MNNQKKKIKDELSKAEGRLNKSNLEISNLSRDFESCKVELKHSKEEKKDADDSLEVCEKRIKSMLLQRILVLAF